MKINSLLLSSSLLLLTHGAMASVTYRVYATREGLVGGTTANGHVIVSRDHFCALPSSTVLNSKGGTTYTVTLSNSSTGKSKSNVPVWDVGPWNTHDNYWHSPRASWTSLPRGKPEAQAAYEDNFNGGQDEFGRSVANPAGIDLADGTFWNDLGMVNNGWINVTYNWEPSLPSERIDVFVRGTGGAPQIHQKYFPEAGWSDFFGMGGTPAGSPDACSFAPNRLDVFIRGTNNALQHKYYDGAWSPWESLGGSMASDPCAVSWGNNRIDVFYRSGTQTNQLAQVVWTSAGGWAAPVLIGGNLVGNPDACSWAANRIDIFGRGADNTLQHKYYNGSWSAWESLGGVLSSDPGCTSWGANRIDVFLVGGTGPQVLQKIYNGSWDANWYPLGGSVGGSPKVCSYQSGRLDILMRGTDGTLQHKYYSSSWSAWESLGGAITGDPGCVSWTTGN